LATKTVNGQRWIAQTVCERVPGHRTSYREGAAAIHGPVVAWNDDMMTSGGSQLTIRAATFATGVQKSDRYRGTEWRSRAGMMMMMMNDDHDDDEIFVSFHNSV